MASDGNMKRSGHGSIRALPLAASPLATTIPSFPRKNAVAEVERAFAEHELKFDRRLIVADTIEERRGVGSFLERMKPDTIIFNVDIKPYLKDIKSRLDIVGGCHIYTGERSISKDMDYTGHVDTMESRYDAAIAAENIFAQPNGKAAPLDLSTTMKTIMFKGDGIVR